MKCCAGSDKLWFVCAVWVNPQNSNVLAICQALGELKSLLYVVVLRSWLHVPPCTQWQTNGWLSNSLLSLLLPTPPTPPSSDLICLRARTNITSEWSGFSALIETHCLSGKGCQALALSLRFHLTLYRFLVTVHIRCSCRVYNSYFKYVWSLDFEDRNSEDLKL